MIGWSEGVSIVEETNRRRCVPALQEAPSEEKKCGGFVCRAFLREGSERLGLCVRCSYIVVLKANVSKDGSTMSPIWKTLNQGPQRFSLVTNAPCFVIRRGDGARGPALYTRASTPQEGKPCVDQQFRDMSHESLGLLAVVGCWGVLLDGETKRLTLVGNSGWK